MVKVLQMGDDSHHAPKETLVTERVSMEVFEPLLHILSARLNAFWSVLKKELASNFSRFKI